MWKTELSPAAADTLASPGTYKSRRLEVYVRVCVDQSKQSTTKSSNFNMFKSLCWTFKWKNYKSDLPKNSFLLQHFVVLKHTVSVLCENALHGCTPSSVCVSSLLCISSLWTTRWLHLCSVCCQQLKHNPARTEGRNESHIFRSASTLCVHFSPTVSHLDKSDAHLPKMGC